MKRVTIDTNVFIAALKSKMGASYRLLSLIGLNKFDIHISVPLIFEYEEIGLKVIGTTDLTEEDLSAIIDYICKVGKPVRVFYLWRPFLSDPSDDMVLELAAAAGCDTIITFNVSDFKKVEDVFGIRVITPRQFLGEIGV
jgi:putative PIN family toxin of toxin-antitoxin system